MILAALWGMVISGMIVFVRVILGPYSADRLVAADALSVIFTLVLVLLSLYSKRPSSWTWPSPFRSFPSPTCS